MLFYLVYFIHLELFIYLLAYILILIYFLFIYYSYLLISLYLKSLKSETLKVEVRLLDDDDSFRILLSFFFHLSEYSFYTMHIDMQFFCTTSNMITETAVVFVQCIMLAMKKDIKNHKIELKQ